VSLQINGDNGELESGFRIADHHMVFWNSKNPGQRDMWSSSVQLSESFYDVITSNPVPMDMTALRALKSSLMAFDIYCWMTYRFYSLRKITHISWPALNDQFGSSYDRLRDFKRAFSRELNRVRVLYPEAKFKITESKLILYPSKTHVFKRGSESCY
jgi:Plasmid encoded RepA protein